MKKRILTGALLIIIFLAGCSPYTSSDVFKTPGHPREFVDFNSELNKIRNEGASFAEPLSGANRQAVQLTDLDNDGVDEGIAFFRDSKSSYIVSVYVFKLKDGKYRLFDKIDGLSSAIESIAYSDILGNGNYEMVIGWKNDDSDINTMTVYDMADRGLKHLASIPYQHYIIYDMNGDGVNEINVISKNEAVKTLVMYTAAFGQLMKISEARLSKGTETVRRVQAGSAAEGVAGIFVESAKSEQGLITDLIIYQDGRLKNVTLDQKTGMSLSTMRSYPSFSEDVNGDGIIEIPLPTPLSGISRNDALWGLIWRSYSTTGNILYDVAFTYHSYLENWFIMLPVKWNPYLTASYRNSRFGETAIDFFAEQPQTGEKKPLFTIYVLTGDNKAALAALNGRFIISEKGSTIYAAELKSNIFLDTKIDQAFLKGAFHFRESEWTMGETVS